MSHTPHELAQEFPDHVEALGRLRQQDAHFARLADEYHDLNRRIHRAETLVEPMESLAEEALRKRRALLKDQIWVRLRG